VLSSFGAGAKGRACGHLPLRALPKLSISTTADSSHGGRRDLRLFGRRCSIQAGSWDCGIVPLTGDEYARADPRSTAEEVNAKIRSQRVWQAHAETDKPFVSCRYGPLTIRSAASSKSMACRIFPCRPRT